MRVVILGAAGQLGRELTRQFGPLAAGLDHWTVDLSRPLTIRSAIERHQPAAVINAAAYTDVDRAEQEPDACRAVNVAGTQAVVEACAQLGCPLVQISSDYVFGQSPAGRPLTEDDPPRPRGVYACSKRDGERLAAALSRHLIIRTCGLYEHPAGTRRNFPRTILRKALERGVVDVVDDQHCTPSYVPHVAAAVRYLLMRALECEAAEPLWGTWHLANAGETTWFEFACELFRQTGVSAEVRPIRTADYGSPAPRPRYSVLCTDKYRRLPGPVLSSWRDALSEYAAAWRQRHAPQPA